MPTAFQAISLQLLYYYNATSIASDWAAQWRLLLLLLPLFQTIDIDRISQKNKFAVAIQIVTLFLHFICCFCFVFGFVGQTWYFDNQTDLSLVCAQSFFISHFSIRSQWIVNWRKTKKHENRWNALETTEYQKKLTNCILEFFVNIVVKRSMAWRAWIFQLWKWSAG